MKKVIYLIIISLFLVLNSQADEGMWMLPLIQKLNINQMNKMGFSLSANEIYDINNSSMKDAVVSFGGFCTGEIISDQGLLITNHHCGFDLVQNHSSIQNDYLKNGFWAMNKEEELENPDLYVRFLISIKDVTYAFDTAFVKGMSEEDRIAKISEISDTIIARMNDSTGYDYQIEKFYGENQFYLFVYEDYPDVRLVAAPPSSIGRFGHETDNWMWPRHTGDFCIFRIYTGPDGKPAEYSKNNIPLEPKYFFPISLKGIERNDFTMVLGYPGNTTRYITSWEVEELLNITHPNRIKIRGTKQEIMMKYMLASDEIRIKYASKYSESSNYWKYSIGQSQSLKRLNVFERKKKQEEEFIKWINLDEDRKQHYGDALEIIQNAVKKRREHLFNYELSAEALYFACDFLKLPMQFRNLLVLLYTDYNNKEEINVEIEELYNNVNEFYSEYSLTLDKEISKVMFKLFTDNVQYENQPEIFHYINSRYKNNFDKYLKKLFKKSIFSNKEKVLKFLQNPSAKVLIKDPAYQFMESFINKWRESILKLEELDIEFNKGHRLYVDGLMKMFKDSTFYPDANFTMRLSYGEVKDYYPKDAVHYSYYTTLKGVMEKENPDNYEFVVPDKLKELYENKDFGEYGVNGVMPICFLSTNDITGGNSGSPVINSKGHLIGVAFDGNWEAMSGDIVYEPNLQRTINVDIRYVLFIIDKFAGAGYLIDEMQIIK